MSKSTDVRICEAVCTFEPLVYRTPLRFGNRIVDRTLMVHVEVIVETHRGKQATGVGSMPIGNVWAWPSDKITTDQSEAVMKVFVERIVDLVAAYPDFGHPIDIIYQISGEYAHLGRTIPKSKGIQDEIPQLAQLIGGSSLDAALHDAFGLANERNSYDLLSSEFMTYDLSEYLDDEFAGEYLDQYTLRAPKQEMAVYHMVGAADPLTQKDVQSPVGDGLPETLADWIRADGLTHFKIKLAGNNLDADMGRLQDVNRVTEEVQAERGRDIWFYGVDLNEGCENISYVSELLNRLREQSPAAFARIQYIEQPTHRDLKAHPQDVREVAAIKPVIIDESLVDYELLLESKNQGYSGVSVKTCKGHTDSLLLAAAAQKFGMMLTVGDLTCPGYAFLHYAGLAARLPNVFALEAMSRQYVPGGSKDWVKRFPTVFKVTDGIVRTGMLDGDGLGF